MTFRQYWILLFLSLTGLVIAMELLAACDNNPDTVPWTALIVEYINVEIAMFLIGGLSLWLIVHFGRAYYKKHKREDSNE